MPTIYIKDDTALVLFEFLSRLDSLDNDHPLEETRFDNAAELNSLWELHGALESPPRVLPKCSAVGFS